MKNVKIALLCKVALLKVVKVAQICNLVEKGSWDQIVYSISFEWQGKPYPQPGLVPFSARTLFDTPNQNVPKGH